VTESDWLSSTDPQAMLSFLRDRGPVSERKLRLFAVACCRRALHLLVDQASREAVVFAERLAEGGPAREEAVAAWGAARQATEGWRDAHAGGTRGEAATERVMEALVQTLADPCGVEAAVLAARGLAHEEGERSSAGEEARTFRAWAAARGTPEEQPALRVWASEGGRVQGVVAAAMRVEQSVQSSILRDIFGNPFAPIDFLPEWRTEAVVALARGIYEERAWERMPVLGDALEDAGCHDPEVLEHCRGAGPHHRGCWVVDLVLGKT
jgi:hypothetical protein